jgi:hypothetical protein
MPYDTKTTAACPIAKPWGVFKSDERQLMGCHASESDANDQIAALYASEQVERAKYDGIDFTPPEGVREEAKQGLEWRREHNRGGTPVGVARARDLSNGKEISPDTIGRMVSYFARHEVDKQGEGWKPGQKGFPSAGRIAWALWGGDAGRSWSAKVKRQMESQDKVERIASVPKIQRAFQAPKSSILTMIKRFAMCLARSGTSRFKMVRSLVMRRLHPTKNLKSWPLGTTRAILTTSQLTLRS